MDFTNKKIKILHIGKFYYPENGGIETINKYIVESTPEFEHRVICFSANNEGSEDVVNGIRISRAATKSIVASQPISTQYYTKLKNILKSFCPDIIHFHHPNPLCALYLLRTIPRGVKLVVHWHSDIVAQRNLYQFIKPTEKALIRRADIIITTSPQYSEASKILKNSQQKIRIIANAIDTSKFALNDEIKAKLSEIKAKYPRKIVFFVGRHVEYKGLKHLLEASTMLKQDCHILIAGTGPLTEKLKESVVGNSKIEWLGRVPDQDLIAHLYAADLLAFPSITRNEAFGLALAEGMYCQTAPVTFTIPGSGVNWVSIHEETGIEVKNSDSMLFAKAIDHLLSNDTLRNQLAVNAHNRIEKHFSMEKIKSLYSSLYFSLMK